MKLDSSTRKQLGLRGNYRTYLRQERILSKGIKRAREQARYQLDLLFSPSFKNNDKR